MVSNLPIEKNNENKGVQETPASGPWSVQAQTY